jgi:hypothetical protein
MADEEKRYFSTKFTVKMFGSRYIPQVCYLIDGHIRATVMELAKKGEACLYSEKVRFVSGIAIPIQKKETAKSIPATTFERPGKKSGARRGKDFD